jgi:hypothetical protein
MSQIGPPIPTPKCSPRLQPTADRTPTTVPAAQDHTGILLESLRASVNAMRALATARAKKPFPMPPPNSHQE